MAEYRLPDPGEGLTEAEIVAWHVAVGDVIAVNDPVVDIETAKSIVELPSPYAGTVEALLVAVGETVEVGTPILRVTTADDVAPVVDEEAAEGPATLVGYGPRDRASRRRSSASEKPRTSGQQVTKSLHTDGAALANPSVQVAVGSQRPLAKPPVRLLARELGVDLNAVAHAGPVITRADVEAATQPAAPAGRATPAPTELPPLLDREYREPVKGVRKVMAQAMVTSAYSAPHVTEWVEVDATRTVERVAALRKDPAYDGVRVTTTLIVAQACVAALREFPELNARWDGEAVTFRRYVNLGIAAATPRGLLVPNIKDAGDLSGPELAMALEQLTATAREGRTQPAEQTGGTFTITNIGVFGIDAGTPIINPGESAILAVGAIRKKPWVVTTAAGDDALAIRHVATLALSFDHRLVDGEKGSRFLASIARALEDPGSEAQKS
ncbi:dihydrolipoamide acetyltransferase family protein [Nocardioides cavernaquae]|uniref:Dihydrolipoamide acetyltransferase component of pyruvate dehydrogenase complex n=1 Tax=Nocardioides cavernaquae TaxID=2321396 RepID=A0A3A5H7Z2_9ACTN|nr:dihydrolipoamide acetyltransferase family protein [Nocardioides cavernaquae]RJS45978.1 2-oxo acid dehydrogenase subunit E2 [Nocardioides cavernaquae]